MSKVTVFDLETQAYVTIDSDEAAAGIKAGRYEGGAQTVKTQTGSVSARSVEDLSASEAVGDRQAPDIAAEIVAEIYAQERRDAYDTLGDKAMTFAEGVVDAASLGLIHEHGESANIRRQENAGSALLGQLVGTAASLGVGGPVKMVAKGSERFGRAAAQAVLGEAASAKALGTIATRAAEEAAIGAGLMGATAFGHQLSDAIIEDKELAGEAVLHEMGLGAALGFGMGALAGGFKVAASRSAIKGQGGLVDGASLESRMLVDEIKGVKAAWRDAADQYVAKADVLKVLHGKGVIPEEMLLPYQEAAKRARKAVDLLEDYPVLPALDAGPKEYERFRKAWSSARKDIDAAGEVFAAPPSAARPQRMNLGSGEQFARRPNTGHVTEGGAWSQELDDMMMSNPENLAAYERMHGRPYEPMARKPIVGEGGLGEGAERFVDDAAAPTDKTNPGGKKRPQPAAEAPTPTPDPELQFGPGSVNRVDGGVTGYAKRNNLQAPEQPGIVPRDSAIEQVQLERTAVGKKPAQPWQPSSPPGKFSLSQYSDDTLAGEGMGFRPLDPKFEGDLLNQANHPSVKGLFPDGYVAPAKDIQGNAEAFAQFREKAAGDTLLSKAEAPAAGPGTRQDWNVVKGDGNKTVRSGKPEMDAPSLEGQTYKDPNVPRGEPLPKNVAKEAVGEVAEDAVEGKTGVWSGSADDAAKTQVRAPKRGEPGWEEFERRAAEDYVEKWYWESKAGGPRINPADEVAVRLEQAMRKLSELSGGRLDSAGALELGEHLGLKATDDMLVDRLDQIWALRKAAKFAADEARGVRGPLHKAGGGMVDEIARRYFAKVGAGMGVAFGPGGAAAGWVIGKHVPAVMGFGARAAASAGKVMQMAVKTGESLLRGRNATVAARAIAGNRPYAYDDSGPIQDPVKRIEKIHQVAANPDQIRATVMNQLGDAALAAPALTESMVNAAVRQMQNLSAMAPPIQRDLTGRVLAPTAGQMRKFHEYENATHDVQGLLGSIQRGAVTPTQAMALAQQHIAVHGIIVRKLLEDPEVLQNRTTAQLRAMEMVTGIPLTPASADPGYVARMQASWAPPVDQGQAQAPQAFKISSPAPTTSQAGATGRAPGNQ